MNTNEQAAECCPFCGAAMMGTRSTDGEYARYKCGNAFDVRNEFPRSYQSDTCATAERERLTRERDAALARVKRLEEAGDECSRYATGQARDDWNAAKEATP